MKQTDSLSVRPARCRCCFCQQPAAPAAPRRCRAPAADPALLFGVRENVEQIDISPDGRRLVFLQPGPGRTTIVYVYDLAGGEPRRG